LHKSANSDAKHARVSDSRGTEAGLGVYGRDGEEFEKPSDEADECADECAARRKGERSARRSERMEKRRLVSIAAT
jgi:hypothetical protein